MLEILIDGLLIVLVLLLGGVVVGHTIYDGRCLTVLLILEDRLTDLNTGNGLSVNDWRQRFKTGVLNMTSVMMVDCDFLMVDNGVFCL